MRHFFGLSGVAGGLVAKLTPEIGSEANRCPNDTAQFTTRQQIFMSSTPLGRKELIVLGVPFDTISL